MRLAIVYAAFLTAAAQNPVWKVVQQGYHLTRDQAAALELEIRANPSTKEPRAMLVGYYFKQVQTLRQDTPAEIRQARAQHIRWLIENDPGSDILSTGDAFAMSGWLHDPENYADMRELWLGQVARAPNSVPVLKNAAYLLQQQDRPKALELIRRAYDLTGRHDALVAGYYGTQLGLLWLSMGEKIQPELDASGDPAVIGSAGRTIAQYSNPDPTPTAYARRLLEKAIFLAPGDKMRPAWEQTLKRLDNGIASGQLYIAESVQLAKRTYPVSAISPANGAATVVVNAVIAADGTVQHTIAIDGPKELLSAAAAEVRKWKFEPTLVNGKGVNVFCTFRVTIAAER